MTRNRGLLHDLERDLLDGKPLADLLRKAVILGGRSRSTELRAWASKELNGYTTAGDIDLPPYRLIKAPLRMDAIAGYRHVTGYPIGVSNLPPVAREYVSEKMPLRLGVGELEAFAAQGQTVRFELPGSDLLRAEMDNEVGDEFQQITSLYWIVAAPSFMGVLDRIRTTLAELLSEIVSQMPDGVDTPTADQADHAVSVVVQGKGNRVNVNAAVSFLGGSPSVEPVDVSGSSWWVRWGRVGAIIVGVATVIAAIPIVLGFLN